MHACKVQGTPGVRVRCHAELVHGVQGRVGDLCHTCVRSVVFEFEFKASARLHSGRPLLQGTRAGNGF